MKTLKLLFLVTMLGGCATFYGPKLADMFGPAEAKSRQVEEYPAGDLDYWADVKPILDNRCVVCHACYDAPCQLKLTAPEGLERGASKQRVYQPERLKAASMTRLFEDAVSVQEWRDKNFHPVLNEHANSLAANQMASPMYQLLELKEQNPLPEAAVLSEEFTLSLDRDQTCAKPDEIEKYKVKTPLWGMPYALPGLGQNEQDILQSWIEQGGNYTARAPLSAELQAGVDQWEAFFNQESNKARLMSRYIYEHVFLAHLYFSEQEDRVFFRLVRSLTPPGTPVELIPSRRPFDDPMSDTFYYRLVPEKETIVVKSHMPYALNSERMTRWQELFLNEEYSVNALPSYEPKLAANPFITFKDIPVTTRYQFMLDEAQFTIMNFIKGPVCRGQVALNVIKDHFWVFFAEPSLADHIHLSDFYAEQGHLLDMPNSEGRVLTEVFSWNTYSKNNIRFLQARDEYFLEVMGEKKQVGLNLFWDGDGHNPNAALTIFRHWDSAVVEQGLLGEEPQTVWVIGYSLLERIHYLLVAGYDVYGNLGHQLYSRLYMDFLRMEGETNFLRMLPNSARDQERDLWYRGAPDKVAKYMVNPGFEDNFEPDIEYITDNPKSELLGKIKQHLSGALSSRHQLNEVDVSLAQPLSRLNLLQGINTMWLPELTVIQVNRAKEKVYFSLIKNNAHLNITSMFKEAKNLLPEENTVSILHGVVGSFPQAFLRVDEDELDSFVDAILSLNGQVSYAGLLNQYGVRRTHPDFWAFSDELHQGLLADDAVEFGILDYSRLENR